MITIFMKNGRTLHFEDCDRFRINSILGEVSFDYVGKSTKKKRHAVFKLEDIAGYAHND